MTARPDRKRMVIWSAVAFGIVVVLLVPSVRVCKDVLLLKRFGSFSTYTIVSGILLAIFLDPCGRFNKVLCIHRWVRRYAVCVMVQSASEIVVEHYGVFVACSKPRWLKGIRDVLWPGGYLVSQGMLGHVTLLRLQIVAQRPATIWANRFFKVALFFGSLVTIISPFHHQFKMVGSKQLYVSLLGISLWFYTAFQILALVSFGRTAVDAYRAASDVAANAYAHGIAVRAVVLVVLLAVSSVTTNLFCLTEMLQTSMKGMPWWVHHASIVLDIPFDAALALLCAGLIGPQGDREADLNTIVELARAQREQYILAVASDYDFVPGICRGIEDEVALRAEVIGKTSSGMQDGADYKGALTHNISIQTAVERKPSIGSSRMSNEASSSTFPGLHPDVQAALDKDPSSVDAQTNFLIELYSCLTLDQRTQLARGDRYQRLGGKAQPAAYAAMKQHAEETDSATKLEKCLRTMLLMGFANVILEETKEILLETYPEQLRCDVVHQAGIFAKGIGSTLIGTASNKRLDVLSYQFQRYDSLSEDGRPIYRNLSSEYSNKACIAWRQGNFGGHWSVSMDEFGIECGELVKWSALPFDAGGDWTGSPEADEAILRKRRSMLYIDAKMRIKKPEVVPGRVFAKLDDLVEMAVSELMELNLGLRKRVLEVLDYLLRMLAAVTSGVDSAVSSSQLAIRDSVNNPLDLTHRDMFRSFLIRLARYAQMIDGDEWEKLLAKELPGFPFDISFVQFMILNCRLFGMSHIRRSEYPMTLIRLHDFVFRAWQHTRVRVSLNGIVNTAVRYLDLHSQEVHTLMEAPAQKLGSLRIVVISDTHGWQLALADRAQPPNSDDEGCGQIFLPKGDILLHCGDLLNEGAPLSRNSGFAPPGSSPSDEKLEEILRTFASLSVSRTEEGLQRDVEGDRDKFKWVFFVGGNHDASLHMLAACGRLAPLLGDSVVLLQSPVEFDYPNPFEKDLPTLVQSTAKSVRIQSMIFNGSIRILEDCTLCSPHSHSSEGVVLAGSGLSLANNAWSANRAFQMQRDASDKLAYAASQLIATRPDIVMTHGPPLGYADEKKGDAFLRNALDESSVKLHFFGHAHSNGIGKDDRPWELHGTRFTGRCFVNASIVTSLYLPTRLPIVVDLPVTDLYGEYAI